MVKRNQITKPIKAIMILLLLLILPACVDKSASIQFCTNKGLQYYGRISVASCDIKCINTTTGEFFSFDGKCDIMIKRG